MAKNICPDARILHSQAVDMVLWKDLEELTAGSKAVLIQVGTEQRLTRVEPRATILRICEGAG